MKYTTPGSLVPMRWTAIAVAGAMLALAGCAGRMQPFTGVAAPGARVPEAELAPGHRLVVFQWEYRDPDQTARGEGAARIAPPDSARLDLFLAGSAAGAAILVGETLRTPPGASGSLLERVVPPAPLLWAALGRVAVPVTSDTTILVEGDLRRVTLGRPVTWRMVFRQDSLVRMERVDGRRVVEWVQRDLDGSGRIRYRRERDRRSLTLTITRIDDSQEFDAAIWRFPQ